MTTNSAAASLRMLADPRWNAAAAATFHVLLGLFSAARFPLPAVLCTAGDLEKCNWKRGVHAGKPHRVLACGSAASTTFVPAASWRSTRDGRQWYVRLLGFRAYSATILLHRSDEHVRDSERALHDAVRLALLETRRKSPVCAVCSVLTRDAFYLLATHCHGKVHAVTAARIVAAHQLFAAKPLA